MISPKIFLVLISVALIWGFNPLSNKLLLPNGNASTFMFIRYIASAITIFIYLALTKQFRLPTFKNLILFSVLGVLAVPLTMYFCLEGLKYSTVTNLALINSISPIIISFFAFILFREKLSLIQWLGIALVTFSTTYLVSEGQISQFFSIQYNTGDIMFLIAQLSWAAYTLIASRMLNKVKLLEMSFWISLSGGLASLIIAYTNETLAMPTWNATSISVLIYATWVNSTLATLLWNYGVKVAGSQVASIFINLSTAVAVATGVFFLGEELTSYVIVGILGIICGIIILTQYKFILYLYQKSLFWNRR